MQERREASKQKKTEREQLKHDKELAKLARAKEREEKKREKKQQKEINDALKSATKEATKEHRPGERLKHMVVVLDTTVSENKDFMAVFATSMRSLEMEYRISSCDEPGTVRWTRVMTERTVNDSAQVVGQVFEVDEKELLVTLEAQGFVGLVHHSKQVQRFAESLQLAAICTVLQTISCTTIIAYHDEYSQNPVEQLEPS